MKLPSDSIDMAMQELRCHAQSMWLDLARSDQSDRWRRKIVVYAEDYFARLPELRARREDALVLICGEIDLRRERGEQPILQHYQSRFPDLAADLALQFEVISIFDGFVTELKPESFCTVGEFKLPGYDFLAEIGRGATSVVFKARQQSLDRLVAIKMMAIRGTDEKRLIRQRQEAEILAHFQHPNVVHIYEVAIDRQFLYLVMEFIDGPTLDRRSSERSLPMRDAARLISNLAETVHAVHEAGVLHRDLKPSNILLTSTGQPKITDFGLAKFESNSNLITTQDSILGTPGYMAPEQASGDVQSIGRESDVYSLGAMLYELLAGRPPFLGATVLDTLHLIREREPVPPRHLQPSIPCDLETICLKCLNKAPRHRYGTALELADDLGRFLAGAPIVARRAGSVERFGRLVKRKPAASIAVALFVLLMTVALMAIWTTGQQRQRLTVAALVDSIATADALALPEMMGRIQAQGLSILPQIRAALAVAAPPESKWVNLAIAEVVADPTAAGDRLLEYLPRARPAEITLLVQTLATRPDVVAGRVWPMLLDDSVTDEPRLRLACLAARISPNDLRWSGIAADVAGALVRQHPLDVGTLSAALSPARTSLIPALMKLSCDPQLEPRAKLTTTGILARYAADQPTILVDLISEAPPEEFRLLLPPLKQHVESALPLLQSIAETSVTLQQISARRIGQTKSEIEMTYDLAVCKQANALVAIWHLGNTDAILPALRRQAEPALQSHLIHLLAPLGIPVTELWQQAQNSTDSGVRQSLILALGQAPLKGMKQSNRKVLADDLFALYRSDPDAGVHSACDWLLRTQLDCESAVQESTNRQDAKLSSDRSWYVGPNEHVFSVFRGRIVYKMGSPDGELTRESDEVLHEENLKYSFAMSTKEVTIAQFSRFNPNMNTNRAFSPTDDCPENDVSWFESAAYCRWLSEQEGLPEEEMCYPPIPQIVPGVRLPENWKTRTGYRLPTSAEWEYACRGGVGAAHFWGDGEQLATQYAWCLRNSDDHAWPVGQLKPNDFGLFDMLGNVLERCNNPMQPYSSKQEAVTEHNAVDEDLIVGPDTRQELRGGNFGDGFHNLRSARRFANSAQDEWASVGFRVVRTLGDQ